MKIILLLFIIYTSLMASSINILDTKLLGTIKVDGLSTAELSALGYGEGKLYALNDKGVLFKLELEIKNKEIELLNYVSASKLRGKKDKALKKKKSDSEGMVFVDGKLLISFERKPRVESFSLNAKKIEKIKINKDLRESSNYRAKNKMLESIAYNTKYGLITTPELPLTHFNECEHTLYTKKHTFALRLCGNITALEFIDEDNLLILQRDMKMAIMNLSTSKLTKIDTSNKYENYKFEGLTKIDKNLYLMVSDNDDAIFQKTLFVLFEILD